MAKKKANKARSTGRGDQVERVEAEPELVSIDQIKDVLHELLSPDDQEIKKEKTAVFMWALRQAGRRFDIPTQVRDRGRFYPERFNDINVDYYCTIFLDLCNQYNKVPIDGLFGALIGVERTQIEQWACMREYANTQLRIVTQKLKGHYEDTIRSYAGDAAGRGNGLAMALLANHDHGWDAKGNKQDVLDASPSVDAIASQVAGLIAQKAAEMAENGQK